MENEKAKRAPGRPAVPGRMVVVKLDERLIELAAKAGNGKITQGIRVALERLTEGPIQS